MGWKLIEKQVVQTTAASVTLGSGGTIPQTYKMLRLVVSARSDTTAVNWTNILVAPNGANTNLSYRLLEGDGAAAASYNNTTGRIGNVPCANLTANTFGNISAEIANYTGSASKPISIDSVAETSATTAYQDLTSLLWANTNAITSLTLSLANGNFVAGSTFYLYGLL